MASVQNLKRDVDNIVFEVISDCFIYTGLHPDSNAEEVSQILNDAVNLRNDLIYRINHPVKSDDPKIVRKHYQNITADLQKEVDLLWGRLSVISKKKKK